MAKINKYWGFVAVGVLTAAAAGAIAAAFLKNRTDLEDFDFDDEDFDQDESEEKPAKESKEAFQSWEPSPNDETENDVTAASQEDTADETTTADNPQPEAKNETDKTTDAPQEDATDETTTEIPVE